MSYNYYAKQKDMCRPITCAFTTNEKYLSVDNNIYKTKNYNDTLYEAKIDNDGLDEADDLVKMIGIDDTRPVVENCTSCGKK